ncbi:MAG: cyclic nucleotide-binding domain-containing protein [Acidobacteriota bacterium]
MPSSSAASTRPITGPRLAEFDLLQGLESQDLEELARSFEEQTVETGQMIYGQGERSSGLYLVQDGEVAVFRDAVGQPVQLLARLHAGDYFGEVALFGTGLSTASARASRRSVLLRADAEPFLAFTDHHPSIQLQLQLSATRRYTENMVAVLETGRRREVRIRCGMEVEIESLEREEEGPSLRVVLENLSLGGLCLSGVPESWTVGTSVRFALTLREGQLPLEGSIRWRSGSSAGLAFVKKSSRHDMLIQMAIRLIHESAQAL